MEATRPCSIPGCEKPAVKRGWCPKHYDRWWRNGDALAHKRPELLMTTEQRFWTNIDRDRPDGCWLWTGRKARGGYGELSISRSEAGRSQTTRAHRYAYALLVGPIPEGMDLDHLCRVKPCVNPAHLDPVTRAENTRRHYSGRPARRGQQTDACRNGHEFTPENTYMTPSGRRKCRACGRAEWRNRAKRES